MTKYIDENQYDVREQMDPVEPVAPERKVVLTDATLIGAIKEAVNDLSVYLTIAKARKIEVNFQFAATQENTDTIIAHGLSIKKDITNGVA